MHQRFNLPATPRNRQRGQASAEYLVITCAGLITLVWISSDWPGAPTLLNVLKSFFGAYSFTLSLP